MNVVEIEGVSQRYGSMTVLRDLTLSLGEGEVLGLFGHNGAGKTTVMKLILGLLKASAGQVHVCLLYTSPSPRDGLLSRMPSSA